MRFAATIFMFILAVPLACGQGQPPPGAASSYKPDELCTVEGTLVNSVSGAAIKKLEVILSPYRHRGQARQQTTVSDANGHFSFRQIEPGTYILQAYGRGYPIQVYSQQAAGHRWTVISLEAGQSEKDIVFRFAPGAVITGMVIDEDGDPVVGATVQAMRTGRAGGGRGSAQSNDRGEYRIWGLEPGKYILVAEISPGSGTHDEVFGPTFYPGTPDAAQASPVLVNPGDEMTGINLMMVKANGVHVLGRLLNPRTGPNRGAQVQLVFRDSELGLDNLRYSAPVKDENGDFEIKGVPPGSYVAMAGLSDGSVQLMGRTNVDVGNADVENLAVVLKPPFDLRGRARVESGAQLDFSRLAISVQPADNPPMGGGNMRVRSDGTFVIHGLYDGNYRVHVGGIPESYYVKSIRLGSLDVLATGLNLTSAASSSLEIELSSAGGTISGTVMHDQKAVPGAFVALVPNSPNRNREDLFRTKTADDLGQFSMAGLSPGDYTIYAWDSPFGVNTQDPDFLGSLDDRGISLRVEEKRQQSVQLESISVDLESR